MKNLIYTFFATTLITACADNSFEEMPLDNNYPLQLVFDTEEGADLAGAEDYDLEVTFADLLPSQSLPSTALEISYAFDDLEGSFDGNVSIDKIVYEVETNDCVYEREVEFTPSADGLSGTIRLAPDADLGTVPESFEIVFVLPAEPDAAGGFTFSLSDIQTTDNLLLGMPRAFTYEVLDSDVAGEWELELDSEEAFEQFREVFGPLHPDLEGLAFEEITGTVKVAFGFEEMALEIELTETETVTTCADGETETETENKVIEIEAEYEAEDGELVLEGSHVIVEDGIEEELDFIVESEYTDNGDDSATIRFFKVVDEDNFDEGEELFNDEEGIAFTLIKD